MIYIVFLMIIHAGFATAKLPRDCRLLEVASFGLPTIYKPKGARKINDLIYFDNKLYIGHGDAVIDTGPTDVIYYNFENDSFVTEFTVDDEAIYYYQVIDGKLVIPGIDATGDWTLGNFYVLKDTVWTQYRTIPNGIHVNSLAMYDDKLYASTGTFASVNDSIGYAFGGIYSSYDNGKTWTLAYATQADANTIYRVGELVVYKDKLYAFPFAYTALAKNDIPEKFVDELSDKPFAEDQYLILRDDLFGLCDVLSFDTKRWRCEDILPGDKLAYVYRPFVYNNDIIIPALFGEYIDYLHEKRETVKQADTKLYRYDGKKTKEVKLEYDRLIDALPKQTSLCLLIELEDMHYIARTTDMRTWKHFLIPPCIAVPKSIEYVNDTFYIGAENGNVFKCIDQKRIKKINEAYGAVPRTIYGTAHVSEDTVWYWITIHEFSNDSTSAYFTASVKPGNVITVTTDNIKSMSVIPPVFYFDESKGVTLIIDGRTVFEEPVGVADTIVCTKTDENGTASWHAVLR